MPIRTVPLRHVVLGVALLALSPLWGQEPVPSPQPVVVPAFTAYAEPDVHAVRRADDGSVRAWQGTLLWYGWFERGGSLQVTPALGDVAPGTRLEFACGTSKGEVDATRPDVQVALVVPGRGYHAIRAVCKAGKPPVLRSLGLGGPAAAGCRFGDVERRNAASVHLGYQVPEDAAGDLEWFHCTLTPRTDPLWSYYMATGWNRGYFGMQVNSPTERRLIFSVWDSGNEAVDRSKVAPDDLVQLVAKGTGVHASGFGNEGTGGHSHLVHPWRLGESRSFLVHAQADGTHTTYSGWWLDPEEGVWHLIASFRAPKDGRLLRGLYSFNENFAGENGHLERHCDFGDTWVRTRAGTWVELTTARFTHDSHGERQRLDRSGAVVGKRFELRNGGFVEPAGKAGVRGYGDPLQREPTKALPKALERLPQPPVGSAAR